MGLFSFLGESFSPGYAPMANAEAAALDNHKKRRAIPLELADMRSAASDKRVAAIENVDRAAAERSDRAVGRGYQGEVGGSPDYNRVANPAMQPMPTTKAAPATGGRVAVSASFRDYPEASPSNPDLDINGEVLGVSPTGQSGVYNSTTHEASATTQKYPDTKGSQALWTAYQSERDPYIKGELFRRYKDTLREETRNKGKRKPGTLVPDMLGAIKGRGPAVTEATFTSGKGLPADMRPTGTKPQVTGGLTFEQALPYIKKFEGGLSMNPDDNGNWTGGKKGVGVLKGTKYGISAASYPNLDIKNLTPEQAKAIYKKDYWDKIGADGIPENVRLSAFDAAVNQGPGFFQDNLAPLVNDPEAFKAARQQRYDNIVANDPTQAQFANSWQARLDETSMATTPGEAVMNATGQPGMNTDVYMQDPDRVSLDLQGIGQQRELLRRRMEVLNQMSGFNDPMARVNAIQELELYNHQLNVTEATVYVYQGLREAQGGQVGILQQAMNTITGSNYQITPYQGGFFSVAVNGAPITQAPVPYDELVTTVRQLVDPAYAESLMAAQAEMSSKLVEIEAENRAAISLAGAEAGFNTVRDVTKVAAETEGKIAVARKEAEFAKTQGLQPTKESNAEGNPIFMDPETGELFIIGLRQVKLGGKKQDTPYLQKVEQ
jgi:hypothetical protein